ncbi:phosphate--nucleotide phosphotransferase [Plantibacter sp. Leaf171]|uniref:polyphosphate kinase 2 family protein n=1 Tax=unclassified Plantibacter TaxID=2624265 RepID=UPI0006FD80EE|nr:MULTISPECIES: polyphosphate kinase 2 family protein [unclassified Plantibacter]KQM17785.1 phosphate--nucleotide phosphotransferase [Plantibacter sp. Leaf1]KQR60567.1 phosphate--nucleotide phosphotransferase [Plantibacter sp. Leaf171]
MSASKHASTWTAPPRDTLRVGEGFRLADVDPASTPGFDGDKRQGVHELAAGVPELSELQERLFAASTQGAPDSVLLVLQAMDTAGKGGIVKHVVGSVDPQGVHHHAFKKPTEEERAHDFLWRIESQVPMPGQIGVFDRSHYEDVLIGRVRQLAEPAEIERRYGAINDFEAGLVAGGTRIVKVMLQISSDEQRARLAERLERPDKHWKYNPGDVDERELWPAYQEAYQTVFERTSTDVAPWFVVPADRKWYARIAVQRLLLDALEDIDPQWPEADYDIAVEQARLAAS